MSLRLSVAVALAFAATALAVAFTLGYELRGAGYDECAPAQPWWNSATVLLVPALAILSEILVFAGAWPRRGARVATAVADTGLLIWFGWYFLELFALGFGCGWLF
jgi:hypothetical protein